MVIGTGSVGKPLSDEFHEHFRREGMMVDVCPTFEAISAFNACVDDEIPVVAALLPPTE